MKGFVYLPLLIALVALADLPARAQPSTITTYVGPSALPKSGSAAANQAIGVPQAVTADGTGGFYFSSSSHNRVYRVTSDGTLIVIAGNGTSGFSGDGGPASSAQLRYPHGVVVDGLGNVFIADTNNNRIRMVTPDGVIQTVAGMGIYGFSGDGGPALSARLAAPRGLAVDQAGTLYVADTNNANVRMLKPGGNIKTIAGTGTAGSSGDGGPATSAQLNFPVSVAIDTAGDLFIADRYNNRIRKVTPDGVISTLIDPTIILDPRGVKVDSSGNVLVADTGHQRILMMTPDGSITTVAGSTSGFGGDGGPALSAQLGLPVEIAVDLAGNIFIADRGNYRVRQVNAARIMTTVAGRGDDGVPASSAQLNSAIFLSADGAGNLFITDADSQRVRKVTPGGIIVTVAGDGAAGFAGDGGPATAAHLKYPEAAAVDSAGNLFIADSRNQRIRKVTQNGIITTIAGNGTQGLRGDGGPATSAQLNYPWSVAVDSAGNVFVADSNNNAIRKIDINGIISTLAGNGSRGFSGDGGPATSAQLASPYGLAVDAADNLFISDSGNNCVRKVTPDGTINTIAGNGLAGSGGDGGPATSAQLSFPNNLTVDQAGNVFVADTGNERIRKITPDGFISTVAGNGIYGYGGDGGASSSAEFAFPYGVALDGTNTLYIADLDNNRVRRVIFTATPFAVADRGGTSMSTGGNSTPVQIGYARIQPGANTTPAGLAIFSYRPGSYLISETGVPATATLKSGRIYAEVNGPVETGLAIANPNGQPATINFTFTDALGDNAGSGTTTIGANQQIARFLDSDPFRMFSGTTFQGTFSFTSDVPVGVVALRGLYNERQDFLMSTLPVIDTTVAPDTGTVVVPHFSDGGGWTTQILLVNPGDATLAGTAEFRDGNGNLANVTIGGQSGNKFVYAISPRSSQKLTTAGTAVSTTNGSVRIVAKDGQGAVPTPLVIFSYRPGGTVTVSEAGVPASSGTAFRLYAESSGVHAQSGAIESGIAVTNNGSAAATVSLELTNSDGSATGLPAVSYNLPGFGHLSLFLSQAFSGLPNPFKGILRVSAPSDISVVGLRSHYNERGDFLITTTPPANELAPPTSAELILPQLVDGGGYTTQLILFIGTAGQTGSGSLRLLQQSGQPFQATLR